MVHSIMQPQFWLGANADLTVRVSHSIVTVPSGEVIVEGLRVNHAMRIDKSVTKQ